MTIKYSLSIPSLNELEIISKYELFSSRKIQIKKSNHLTPYWSHSIPIEEINGIYILFKKGNIVKIGQSQNIYNRLNQHDGKKFHSGCLEYNDWDSFAIINCENEIDKFIIEGVYVHMFKPVLNRHIHSRI